MDQNQDNTAQNKQDINDISNETPSKEQLELIVQLEECQQKIIELEDKYKRSLAEKMNIERQQEAQKAFLTSRLLEQLIDIKEDLDTVVKQIPENEKDTTGAMGSFMTFGKLNILLLTNDVHEIEVKEDDEFNPSFHEAISVVENPDKKNKIINIVRKGYLIKDRVVKSVKVVVGK